MASRSLALERFALRRKPDADVFEKALIGDPVAFSEVYRRYEKRIYGYCLSRTFDPEIAADATQEVFVRLLHAAPGPIGHPRAWLFAVARNVIVDVVRKRVAAPEGPEIAEDSPAWERLSVGDSAEKLLLREDAKNVFLALRRLIPRYRTALILREIHRQSSADIAEALGTTPGAVDTLVSRARDAFGAAYAEVSGLPERCRESVALIYQRTGTGLDEAQRGALESHLASCARCRAEDRKARSPKYMSALLPLILPGRSVSSSILAQAAATAPGASQTFVEQCTAALDPHTLSMGTKAVAALLAAGIVTVPIVGALRPVAPTPRVSTGAPARAAVPAAPATSTPAPQRLAPAIVVPRSGAATPTSPARVESAGRAAAEAPSAEARRAEQRSGGEGETVRKTTSSAPSSRFRQWSPSPKPGGWTGPTIIGSPAGE